MSEEALIQLMTKSFCVRFPNTPEGHPPECSNHALISLCTRFFQKSRGGGGGGAGGPPHSVRRGADSTQGVGCVGFLEPAECYQGRVWLVRILKPARGRAGTAAAPPMMHEQATR